MKTPRYFERYYAAVLRYNQEFDQIQQARRNPISLRQRRQLAIDLRRSIRDLGKATREMTRAQHWVTKALAE